MEQRTLIAITVCLTIFIGWVLLFPDAMKAPQPKPAPVASQGSAVPPAPAPAQRTPPVAAPATPPAAAVPAAPSAPVEAAQPLTPAEQLAARPAEQVAVVEVKGLHRVELSSWGGRVRSFQLLAPQFRVGDEPRTLVEIVKGWFGMVPPPAPQVVRPVDVVTATEEPYWPLALTLPRSGLELTGREAYRIVLQSDKQVVFRWDDPAGRVRLEKDYRFQPNSNLFELEVRVTNLGASPLFEAATLNASGRQDPKASEGGLFTGPGNLRKGDCLVRDEVMRTPVKDVPPGGESHSGVVKWAGTADQYFLQAILPEPIRTGSMDPAACAFFGEGMLLNTVFTSSPRELAPTSTARRLFRIYFGPKQFYELRKAGQDLQQAVDFNYNWLRVICEPMLWLMRLFHSWVGNWGLAIIFLTIFVKILLFYFTQRSMQSMAAMQKVKPEMDRLREKYANDKAKLNQEMIDLYKRHKVNPVGGCLPMLLQMPIYIALYQTIYSSSDLYKADFVFWLKDLSTADPYFITPLLLGVVMFVQQRITPAAMDSAQQRMMMWMMPILFTGLMLFLPSGLVVYILANSILTIGQQMLINRKRTVRA